jgi:ankyrin repeat protein
MFNNSKQTMLSPNERLSKAAEYGDLEGIKKAIEDGAILDYNLSDNHYNNHTGEDRNPLLLAIRAGNEEVAKYLLDKVETIDGTEYYNIGSIGKKLFEAAKTDEMKLLIAEKADIRLFAIQGSARESLAHTLKAMLKQYRQKFAALDSKIESKGMQMVDVKKLLEAQNLAIKQIQAKNDLIAQQNDIIKHLNEELIQQKAVIVELQFKHNSLAEDKTLSIEVNEHERQLQELKQEIAALKTQLNKGRFKDKAQNATTIQALALGFLTRKNQSLKGLKEQRKAEIQAKLPEAMGRLATSGKYEDMARLAEAMKHERLHEAMQIIRGKSEQEVAIGSRLVKY